jgi:glycosyltransferase involved in cell wall biosynthesis
MGNKKKILIISEVHLIKTFVLPTVKKLEAESNATFDCFIVTQINNSDRALLEKHFVNVLTNKQPKGFIKKIPRIRVFFSILGLRQLANSLSDYDIAHIHFHHHYYSYFTRIIRTKAKKLFITFFGSDFNQVENFRHKHNQKSINVSDAIFTTNQTLLNKIVDKYKVVAKGIKYDTLVPLMDTFEVFESYLRNTTQLDAKALWQAEDLLVVCGYSASAISRHKLIIDALSTNLGKLSNVKLVFPMTYGQQAIQTRIEVRNYLNEKKIDAEIIEKYLELDKLQGLRLAADIFVHIQSRDQMSASMLEHLVAGSVVITGKWLPYESLIENGVYMVLLEKPEDLADTFFAVIDHLEDHKKKSEQNRRIILEMISWNNIKENWYKYYELEAKA